MDIFHTFQVFLLFCPVQRNDLLENSPSLYGYQDAHWTTALLVDYFSGKGLTVSRKTIERVLHKQAVINSYTKLLLPKML